MARVVIIRYLTIVLIVNDYADQASGSLNGRHWSYFAGSAPDGPSLLIRLSRASDGGCFSGIIVRFSEAADNDPGAMA